MSPARPGCHPGQHKLLVLVALLIVLDRVWRMLILQVAGNILMPLFSQSKIPQQLARVRIAHLIDCSAIKASGLILHRNGLIADFLQKSETSSTSQVCDHKTANMLTPDKRDRISKLALIHLDQITAMLISTSAISS